MRIIVMTGEHPKAVPVRHVAQLLGGFLTVYAGVVLALDPDSAEEVMGSLSAGVAEATGEAVEASMGPTIVRPVVGAVFRALERTGGTLLQGDAWPEPSLQLQMLVTGSLARRWAGGDAFGVGSLGAGSVYIDIEIARDLERLSRGFVRIIRKVGGLLPWRPDVRADEITGAVRDVVPPGPTALAGAGVIGVGVPQVVSAAVGLRATGITVE